MPYSFKKILVPVDFTINTEVAIKKALELAEQDTEIHLVHVLTRNSFKDFSGVTSGNYSDHLVSLAKKKILQLKQNIEEVNNKVVVSIDKNNSIQKCIEIKAKELRADLIVIGKKSQHSLFPFLNTVIPNTIAKHTRSAVLTVKPGSIHRKIKIIVVPITTDNTYYKTEIISAITGKFNARIYLVTFKNDDNGSTDFQASSLLRVFQWIKNSLHCPVEYAVLNGSNKAKTILNYAEKLNADILLVNPESEDKMGWFNRHISDMLPAKSGVQILSVQSAVKTIF